MNTTKNRFRKADKIKVTAKKCLAFACSGLLKVCTYHFDKVRIYTQRDGYSNEVPYDEHCILITKRGQGALWLTSDEIRTLHNLLEQNREQTIDTIAGSSEKETGVAA